MPSARLVVCLSTPSNQLVPSSNLYEKLHFAVLPLVIDTRPVRDLIRSDFERLLLTVAARLKYYADMGDISDQIPHEIPQDAVEAMQSYDWPGNLRELRAAMIRVGIDQNWNSMVAFIESSKAMSLEKQNLDDFFDHMVNRGMVDRALMESSETEPAFELLNTKLEARVMKQLVRQFGASPRNISRAIHASPAFVAHRESYRTACDELGVGRRSRGHLDKEEGFTE